MIYGFEQPDDEELASLTKEMRVRVLNCSGSGCLLETDAPIAVGAIARLRITFGGREFDDTVRIVRCQHRPAPAACITSGPSFFRPRRRTRERCVT